MHYKMYSFCFCLRPITKSSQDKLEKIRQREREKQGKIR
jgi:hypothetical protein